METNENFTWRLEPSSAPETQRNTFIPHCLLEHFIISSGKILGSYLVHSVSGDHVICFICVLFATFYCLQTRMGVNIC